MTWAEAYGKNFPKQYNALLNRGIQKAKNNGNEDVKLMDLENTIRKKFRHKK